MADHDKTRIQQNSDRIINWLLEHRAPFEQEGIEESTLSGAVGLSEEEVTAAIDYLENHEDLARFPVALSNPPRFLLKPARGWREIVARPQRANPAIESS
jgi:hypothetical protein